jgi:hypothetical protein
MQQILKSTKTLLAQSQGYSGGKESARREEREEGILG